MSEAPDTNYKNAQNEDIDETQGPPYDIHSNFPSDKLSERLEDDELRKSKSRYHVWLNARNVARREESRKIFVKTLADVVKRKSNMLKERDAIVVFPRPDVPGMPEAILFFQAIRRIHLARVKTGKFGKE